MGRGGLLHAPEAGVKCPLCAAPCECDMIDLGSGGQQVSPYICPECLWAEPYPKYGEMVEPHRSRAEIIADLISDLRRFIAEYEASL